jgi:fimbrial isopeptide formation D2 family protein/LPXTG-motif cell wall-anchored protein
VSADYYAGGNSVDLKSFIGSSTVLKKSSIPFDKMVANDEDKYIDTKPGDIIPYKITSTIPSYGTQFTNPKFIITDTLSDGLELNGDITVKYGEKTTTESVANEVTITKDNSKKGFTVTFNSNYLSSLNGATPKVEITYNAKVTTAATNNVTYMDNKAVLTYSNRPGDESSKDDITRHYTFSIDANINGQNHGGERTRELIKIGIDSNGQTITDFTSWVDGQQWTDKQPLAGAEFTLTAGNNKWTAVSDDYGYITFNGLDVGEYTLTETSAPNGYVKDNTTHKVIISANYDQNAPEPDKLVSYTVTVDDNAGTTYTIDNMDTLGTITTIDNVNQEEVLVETTVTDGALTFPFVNTKGTELPTTGGIGTTIFYVVGGVMVTGAVVFLLTKRRMAGNE